MTTDNEFPDDNERTIFIPKPSGRGPASVAAPTYPQPPQPQQQSSQQAPLSPQYPPSFGYSAQQDFIPSGVNPLVCAAAGLVALPGQLLTMASHHDVDGLRNQVLEEIKAYENKARVAAIDTDVTYTARYVLCAFIDEAVLNTIWGSDSSWNNQSLLSTLHNETSGGETFFMILDRLLKDPNASLDLLELMFICISLGFKGKYSVLDRGHEKLEELKGIIFEQIRRRRGEFPQELSPHWQSQSGQRTSMRNYIPLWVVVAVASALLLAIFLGFSLVLDETADPVYEALESIGKTASIDITIDN